MDKRFIEDSFPVKEVSKESAREKNIRFGNISTLHLWWARRPLASSRATNYAALIPAAKDEIDWVKKRNFIIELSKWENSLNDELIESARKHIFNANGKVPPKVLDPFSGGGAIPLEALRLGCDTYANDYNPVAVLIEKCTLEFPQKYGKKLVKDVTRWGNWVLKEVKNDIGDVYPVDKNKNGYFGESGDYDIPTAYLWARTIKCQNPSCGIEIPLMRQYRLAKKKNKNVFLVPQIKDDEIKFKICGDGFEKGPEGFDPGKGTITRALVQCPSCHSTLTKKELKKQFHESHVGQKLIAVVTYRKGKTGKNYRLPIDSDLEAYNLAKTKLSDNIKAFEHIGSFHPIPNESITYDPRNLWVVDYLKENNFSNLFNHRQNLELLTFTQKIKESFDEMRNQGYDKDYAIAIVSYLALGLSRIVDRNSASSVWNNISEKQEHTYGRQALPMAWDYAETNVLEGTQGWEKQFSYIIKTLDRTLTTFNNYAKVTQSSATSLEYPDDFFDAVFTDPPYYDNVTYANLSDFFYVWLKRALSDFYPDMFITPLTPKKLELIADPYRHGGKKDSKKFFETNLKKSFKEIYRVLKPNGITTIVYAHKTTEGWETVINALLDSGLTITASWPISTEMKARFRAQKSAALASSIYIVARKLEKQDIGWYKDVKKELSSYIPIKLDQLWEEGISGADFFIAAIGSAIEIFGKYDKVLDNEGNEIRADKILNFVRSVVTDYAVRHILHNGIADELSPLTKFYLLWKWNYQEAKVQFDDARKIAQSAGIDLANEWNKGFIIKKGAFISIQGPDEREDKSLVDSKELIDVLHHVCLLWKEGKKDEMKSILKKSGYGEGDALYKVAQAIAETLPNNSSEKKMIEGFLASRDKIIEDMKEDESQTKLV